VNKLFKDFTIDTRTPTTSKIDQYEGLDIASFFLIAFILKTSLLITLSCLSQNFEEALDPHMTRLLFRPILLVLFVTCLKFFKSFLTFVLITSYVHQIPFVNIILIPSIAFINIYLKAFLFATFVVHFF